MHLEAGYANPFSNTWVIDSLLKGTNRILGASTRQTLPITPSILFSISSLLNLSSSFDIIFWAACLVTFSFFRKSNLLVTSLPTFNPSLHLCRKDVSFSADGAVLAVRWSKTIQYRQRVLSVPLPRIPSSPLAPRLLSSLRFACPLPQQMVLFSLSLLHRGGLHFQRTCLVLSCMPS